MLNSETWTDDEIWKKRLTKIIRLDLGNEQLIQETGGIPKTFFWFILPFFENAWYHFFCYAKTI
jgi:hypothetical protein